MNPETLEQLRKIVGPAHLLVEPEELLCYSYDGSGRELLPAAVAFPASSDEVSRILQLAHVSPFPVAARGAGTGMAGGALPAPGGLVLVMTRLNRIIEIDRENQIAVVEPGLITGELRRAADRLGLYYPPDPASFNFCTIGGNVACGAGGPSAVKYGVTRDYILGLEAVLADGSIIHTGVRTAKGVVGYDLTRLLVGSEGTLAVITRIILRLLPAPEARTTFLVCCIGMAEATALVTAILAKLTPCTLEYLDRTAISLVSETLPFSLPSGTGAMLLIELDGDRESLAPAGRRLNDLLADRPEIIETRQASSLAEADQLWAARRSVSPASFKLRPNKISDDLVVPRSRIPYLVATAERLSREERVIIFTFGHAGDGNIHVNIMLDRNDPDETSRAEAARQSLFAEALRLGGTLSGEHGVGLSKAASLPLEIDPATLALMRRIKQAFDPTGILNPGKIFPPAPQSADSNVHH